MRLEQSLELWEAMSDKGGMSEAIVDLAHKDFFDGDWVTSHRRLDIGLALARETGDRRRIAFALYRLGHLIMHEGDLPAARASLEESLRLFREIGWQSNVALVLNGLGEMARTEGDYDRAAELYHEVLVHRWYRAQASPSSAANLAGTIRIAQQLDEGTLVTVLPDNADKYSEIIKKLIQQ